MTTYILAGGNDRAVPTFRTDLLKALPPITPSTKFVSCFFAVPPKEWEHKAASWRKWVSDNLAIADYGYTTTDNFKAEVRSADIVFFHGGNTDLLKKSLTTYPDLANILADKTVVGSSAGANILANNYWSSTFKHAGAGFGLVPANTMVHYGARNANSNPRTADDWDREEQEFAANIGSSNILHIPEGTIVTFDIP